MDKILVGIDEAGMGTLAGPMTASVIVIRESQVPTGVRDSKKLSEERREELAALIMDAAEYYKTAVMDPRRIDEDGLSICWWEATRALAKTAYHEYVGEIDDFEIIIDGNRLIGLTYVRPVVKADVTHPAVAAASILAKYTQCCYMDDYHLEYPKYGFDHHRGYPTVTHKQALKELGPCPIHRKSFKPIKRLL